MCVNLLYSFDQAESFSPTTEHWKLQPEELEFLLNSITTENQYIYILGQKRFSILESDIRRTFR